MYIMGAYNKCIQLACTIGVYIMAGYILGGYNCCIQWVYLMYSNILDYCRLSTDVVRHFHNTVYGMTVGS